MGLLLTFILSHGQFHDRANHIDLDLKQSAIYDSLFNVNDWRKEFAEKSKINTDSLYGKNWLSKMLKIGNTMPDLSLGTVSNNYTGKSNFSDFRGKIIILDFWGTSCSNCIDNFPKMEALQRKFGDQIQIFLVNVFETQEDIKKRMGHNITKIPNLPSIVNATHLFPYFPTLSVPYHVWIDKNGIIQVLGSGLNTYEKKIQDLLNNKPIESLNMVSTTPGFNVSVPYFQIAGYHINPKTYNSFFTSFNNHYAVNSSNHTAFNQVELTNGSTRNTFINCKISYLYFEAFKSKLWNNTKYIVMPNLFLYDVRDTLRYEDKFIDVLDLKDTTYIKSRFCYEQVYPKYISNEQSKKMMAEDLNDYFGKMYGTYGRMERRSIPGYVIIKRSGDNFKKLFSKAKEYREIEFVKNGKMRVKYEGVEFKGLFDSIVRGELIARKKMLVNETNIDGNTKIDIEFPFNATLTDIKQALKPYGLDIIEKNIEVELLVISDTKVK